MTGRDESSGVAPERSGAMTHGHRPRMALPSEMDVVAKLDRVAAALERQAELLQQANELMRSANRRAVPCPRCNRGYVLVADEDLNPEMAFELRCSSDHCGWRMAVKRAPWNPQLEPGA